MSKTWVRTDLASEWGAQSDPDGIETRESQCEDYQFHHTHIKTQSAAQALGKPQGRYAVLHIGAFHRHLRTRQSAIHARLVSELQEMIKACAPNAKKILVVGLGNREVTPDALGPLCVHEITVTRHLRDTLPHLAEASPYEISAIAPGVIGQTGIETQEQIKACIALTHPELVIAIDALAARSVERLMASVQMTDSGISPGSGVGNRRCALNASTLGVPVIAIGVPTVTDSSTLVYDALEQGGVEEIPHALEEILHNGKNFFVTAKDGDIAVHALAKLIAHAINAVLSPALSESAFA